MQTLQFWNVLQALVAGFYSLTNALKEDKWEKDKEVNEARFRELAEQMQETHVQMIEVS